MFREFRFPLLVIYRAAFFLFGSIFRRITAVIAGRSELMGRMLGLVNLARLFFATPAFRASIAISIFLVSFQLACASHPATPPAQFARPPEPPFLPTTVRALVERIANDIVRMDRMTLFGLVGFVAMLLFYIFKDRSPFFILAFAIACWMGSAYCFLRWARPFGIVGGIGGCLAVRKWWLKIKSGNVVVGTSEHPILVWPTRYLYVAAIICAVILLIVDSPIFTHLRIPVSRAVVEAAPLLLVGIASLARLAIDRPTTTDMIKQVFIAVAFILWGIDLLMPAGPWARFVGAVVIAIYVFDLAWLMEGNLRKKPGASAPEGWIGCASVDCRSTGVCRCDSASGNPPHINEGGRRPEMSHTRPPN